MPDKMTYKNLWKSFLKALGFSGESISDNNTMQDIDFMDFFNKLSGGIIVFDNQGKIIAANIAADKLLDTVKLFNKNKPADNDKMSDIDKLYNIKKETSDFKKLVNTLRINVSLEELVYIENIGGKEFFADRNGKYLKLQFISIFENKDRADMVVVAVNDCSEQKSLEDRRKDFVANVSHELKTPITSIMSYSEALLDNDMDPDTRNKFLNVIISEAGRMDRLIGDLLQLSKLSGENFPLNRRRYSFSALIKNSIEKINLEAENHNLTIKLFLIGDLPEVMMDVDKMHQVMLNILSNSIKYTPEKGVITIYAGRTFNWVYAKISDTGIGIPEDMVNRVFERFYRVDKARSRQQGGTGLGLAISKEIVEAHSGIITISSEFGKGTDVMIKLPTRSQNKNDMFYL